MSLLNGSQGPHSGRPQAQSQVHPQWGPAAAAPAQAPQYAQQQPYGNSGYGAQMHAAPQPGAPAYPAAQAQGSPYGQAQDYGFSPAAPAQDQHYGAPQAAGGYAQQYEPYAPQAQPQTRAAQPAYQQHAPAPAYGHQAQPQPAYAPQAPAYGAAHHQQSQQPAQWPAPAQDGRGFDLGGYLPQNEHQQDWHQQGQTAGYHGETDQAHGHGEMGFGQAAGGELDQGYAEDEAQDYEAEDAPRSRRPIMMAAALAGAIFVGGGLAYSYKAVFGGGPSGEPPVIKSASNPAKIKPADGGGKQFAHTDSKIMGRLGEGSAGAGGADAGLDEAGTSGTRKVSTLVVGRDGSIQAPAAAPADGAVSIPGMTVIDGLGAQRAPAAAAQIAAVTPPAQRVEAAAPPVPAAAAPAPQKTVVAPPAAPPKPIVIAKAAVAAPEPTGSIETEAAAPAALPVAVPVKPAVKKVAAKPPVAAPEAAAPAPAPAATGGGGANGYVAVLASVPVSDSSRMSALKQFADLQQKYGAVLGGKTPDVAEANLGQKGAYHRLVVGPPGSREQASSLCTDLKAQGYTSCWVTAY